MVFKINSEFIQQYKNLEPNFGFNGLGEITYLRSYSRKKENGEKEKWFETVERVVNGTYSIQKEHINKYGLGWNEEKAQESAKEMYERIFKMKFLPPGYSIPRPGINS